jgi:pimeloyl-ACP methyl ester carboxylesterase
MTMLQPPVIVIPGITGTQLDDYYPLETETVWSAVLHKEFSRIALHPDDLRYEAIEPARVLPRNPYDIVYGDLVAALRHDLSKKADRPTPVYGFGYDWRQDCSRTALQLDAFVDEVLARSRLLPHYRDEPPRAVDFVAHSMGGLIVAKYLHDRQAQRAKSRGAASKTRRVVTIGTPFRGSVNAILKLTTGMGTLTGPDPRDREREASRTIPALYQLLPSYQGAIEADPDVTARSLFRTDAWQPSVVATLREFIRLRKAQVDADKLLQRLLDQARSFIDAVNAVDPDRVLDEGSDGWLPVVGIAEKTHVRARIVAWRGQPWFDFPEPVNERAPDGRPREATGDGTVAFLGACADFLARERLVCVAMDDLSFWEVRDRVLAETGGLHGFLPKVNLVQKLVIRFLRKDFGGDFEARRAPGAARCTWPSWLREKR